MDAPLLSSTRALLATLLLAAPLAAASSCATLETIPENACGNGVLESKRGEDCDGPPANRKHQCGAAGTQHACKYVWEEEGDACPTDYEKSPDKRCRKPSGNFELAATFTANGAAPRLGDFDGDGQVDLATWVPLQNGVGSSEGRIEITSLDGGVVGAFPGTRGDAFTELSGDDLNDLLLLTSGRFSVLRSRDGEPNLKVYPLEQKAEVAYFALPSWALGNQLPPDATDLDLDVVGRLEPTPDGRGQHLCLSSTSCMDLDDQSVGLTHLLAHSREHWVYAYLYSTGLTYIPRAGYTGSFPPAEGSGIQLSLPAGHRLLARPGLLDANGDGDVDLVLLTVPEPATSAYVTVLDGELPVDPGTYFSWDEMSDPTPRLSLPLPTGLDPANPVEWAVGDVNGDGKLDFAYNDAVYVSRSSLPAGLAPADDYYDVMPWPRGGPLVAGDLNADGLSDFVSVVNGVTEVVFGGDQLPLSHYPLEGVGQPARLGVSDFDGDGADDLFVALSNRLTESSDCNVPDDLIVAYGRAGSFPEPFQSVAALSGIDQLTTGRFLVEAEGMTRGPDGFLPRQDNFGDLYVSARCKAGMETEQTETSALSGNPQRAMRAPFTFDHVMGASGPFSVDTVGAADLLAVSGDSHADVIVLGEDLDDGGRIGIVLPSYGDAEIDAEQRVAFELPSQARLGGPAAMASGTSDPMEGQWLAVASVIYDDEQQAFSWGLTANVFSGGSAQLIGATATVTPPPDDYKTWKVDGLKLISAELNGDDAIDFVALATFGADDVGISSPSMGEADVPEVEASTGTVVMFLSSDSGGYTAQAIDPDQLFSPVDLVVGQGEVMVVGSFDLYLLRPAEGTLLPRTIPIEAAGMQGAVSLDYNNDKLDDLIVVTGSQAQILTQLPFSTQVEDLLIYDSGSDTR